ncbi:hypothetical protein EG329_002018 [Mollisiaceae sp. DMI_Dod_QoI]|nr:hypothetical protein EG329_002018 [Helotiales sp. DMI_Dod_QoI]
MPSDTPERRTFWDPYSVSAKKWSDPPGAKVTYCETKDYDWIKLWSGGIDPANVPQSMIGRKFDTSIGKVVAALEARGVYNDTPTIVDSKHGQAPIDPSIASPKHHYQTRTPRKVAEHGSLIDDDREVTCFPSASSLTKTVYDNQVFTKEFTPTILQAVELDPMALQGVVNISVASSVNSSVPCSFTNYLYVCSGDFISKYARIKKTERTH